MIAEVVPDAYDYEGKRTFNPNYRKKGFSPPTFPLGIFKSQPLQIKCASIDELIRFLESCRYVSDMQQFGKEDYWMPPDEFEKVKNGDCEDFAFYAWRQLSEMGYEARVVLGRVGASGHGHAWVQFENNGSRYIMEPLMAVLGSRYPRLSVIRRLPIFSITWNGEKMEEYLHQPKKYNPTFREAAALFGEWVSFWARFWIMNGWKVPFGLIRLPFRLHINRRRNSATKA